MTLVQDAQRDGARLAKACQVMGINVRTYYRWVAGGEVTADRRPDADRPEPANKLSPEEREAIVALCNAPEYRSRPPAFIVADQADKGRYLASESTMYRVLHEYDQQHHRGRQQAPQRKRSPTTHQATAPNRLWCWDISWLPGPARGTWWYLYLIMDVFSRKIVGHEVYETETGELAAELVPDVLRTGEMIGVDMCFDNPVECDVQIADARDHPVRKSMSRAPGMRAIVHDRIDQRAAPALPVPDEMGDGVRVGVEETLHLRRAHRFKFSRSADSKSCTGAAPCERWRKQTRREGQRDERARHQVRRIQEGQGEAAGLRRGQTERSPQL